ncbi:dihydroorotase [Atribacter laminatus]|uniref:Dihydroorotase n=1 Tax=Atribacter laminatus TaxID=2847778 RepID=A0A7T1AJI9_ATRLM|nr:dihydroorotase [Atribacter laminatus]QPM67086.1 Dihydroorotase [Atribacter laminatus]
MNKLLIKNGTVILPQKDRTIEADVLIDDGVIVQIEPGINDGKAEVINASGCLVGPGFINIHVHFREPGEEKKEDLLSGSRAAIKGGFTSVLCMPNTRPPIDSPLVISYLLSRAREIGLVNVFLTAAISLGLEGKAMTDVGLLKNAGAIALSDDGKCVKDSLLLYRLMTYSKYFHMPIILHEEDTDIAGEGQVNEGKMAFKMGYRSLPKVAEDSIIARDLVLAHSTEALVHFTHLSTAMSVKLIEWFQGQGVKVSSDVTPHHLLLDDQSILQYGNQAKVKPPLRDQTDIVALKEGIQRGVIKILASDHAPHTHEDKEGDFNEAAFGISNLEIAVPLYAKALIEDGIINWLDFWKLLSFNPAQFLGLIKKGSLETGMDADITILDPDTHHEVKVNEFVSKGRNCPFDGWQLKGWPVATIVNGKIMMRPS